MGISGQFGIKKLRMKSWYNSKSLRILLIFSVWLFGPNSPVPLIYILLTYSRKRPFVYFDAAASEFSPNDTIIYNQNLETLEME